MGRQALLAVVSLLTISGSLAVNNFVFKDQQGAETGSRLYRQAAGGVYASAVPYGAYTFQIPTISAPQQPASKVYPVKESYKNVNGYLQDSYGNRFVEALQSMKALPLKPFPQQYVQLQELPAHLAQPLAAASPHYRLQNQAQQFVPSSHYRLPLQNSAAPVPTPLNQQFSFAHPGVYADTFKNLAPAAYSFGPNYGSVIHLPVRSAAPAQAPQNNRPQSQEFSQNDSSDSEHQNLPSAQQQSTSNKAVYAETLPHQQQYQDHHLKGQHKFQRLQDASGETYSEEEPEIPTKAPHKMTTKEIVSATKLVPIPTVVNGKKTIVNVKTKPPLPLLNIDLLEPLTFANPLVPQVQHFLPRIAEATYHKLPELGKTEDNKFQKEYTTQKTKTYDSGVKGKPKKPRKKQKTPEVEHFYNDDYIPAATARPTVTVKNPDESPEISYEINTPNHKETYKEQAVKYNKEINSEPVHYTYGTNSHKEPVHYSYTHSSKEPVHIQEVRYEGKGKAPKHLINDFKSGEHKKENVKSTSEHENSEETSDDDVPQRSHHREHKKHHSHRQDSSKSSHHYVPEHREQEYKKSHPDAHHKEDLHDKSHTDKHHNMHRTEKDYSHKGQQKVHSNTHQSQSVDVIPYQYEEDISLSSPIKVDPNHNVQKQPQTSQEPQQPRPNHTPRHYTNPKPQHETPSTHVHEKTKQIYMREVTPEEDDTVGEQPTKSMFDKEEDKEREFENAYKNAAYGFPAFNNGGKDVEKDIYSPESYGVSPEHSAYNIDYSPFQQYQEPGNNFPKEMRINYQDDRNKLKEDYFLDYSISKPESLVDRYKNKANYYKLYKDQKPEKYVYAAQEDDKNKQKESAKLTAIPYTYYPVQGDMKKFFAQYNAAPLMFEHDYSKGTPTSKDSSAYASRPFQRLMNTHFVEPQFQYGFEPIALPQLLDSELAAMSTNNSPKSEKPGTRKKIYKENFYIKQTSMSDGGPNS